MDVDVYTQREVLIHLLAKKAQVKRIQRILDKEVGTLDKRLKCVREILAAIDS